MTDEPMITIPLSKLNEYIADSNFLSALEAAGVDNWCGYEHAQEMLAEMEAEQESF